MPDLSIHILPESSSASLERLLGVMMLLRDPAKGCPWDLEQDWKSLAPYTLEEAHEVVDAAERGDIPSLRDELGDLLLQVVFYSQIAQEKGVFNFDDVASGCVDKMVRRHPHVFSDARLSSSTEQAQAWEDIKEKERNDKREGDSALNGIALSHPAITRALKLQGRAARVGFDWANAHEVLGKVSEELDEVRAEMTASCPVSERLCDEIGDLLFSVVNLARKVSIDPEAALRSTNIKFDRRFRRVESLLRVNGKKPQDVGLGEMEALWVLAKQEEQIEHND